MPVNPISQDDIIPPDVRSTFNEYLNDVLKQSGQYDASNREKRERLKEFRDEEVIKKGFVLTPDGQRRYIKAGAGGFAPANKPKKNVGGSDAPDDEDKKKRTLYIYGGLIAAGFLLLLFGSTLLSGGGLFGTKPTPTPVEVAVEASNYTAAIEGLNPKESKLENPKSFEYNGKSFLLKPSNNTSVSQNKPWCSLPSDSNLVGCWLQGSFVNVDMGFSNAAYQEHFKDAKPGEVILVNFGNRKVQYTIDNQATVTLTDTNILLQQNPRLTMVFFDALDKKGNAAGSQTRQVIVATPNQEFDSTTDIVDDTSNDIVITYEGNNTPVSAGDINTLLSAYTYLADENGKNLKVIFKFAGDAANLSGLQKATALLSLDNGANIASTSKNLTPSSYDITFVFPNPGTDFNFTLNLKPSGGQPLNITGTLSTPIALQYLTINATDITATYTNRRLTLEMMYSQAAESQELCKSCYIVVGGVQVMPNDQVWFVPTAEGTKAKVQMTFNTSINIAGLSTIQLYVGPNRAYELYLE